MAWVKGQSGNPAGMPRGTHKRKQPLTEAINLALNRIQDGDPRGRRKLTVLADRLVEVALGHTDEPPALVGQARQMIADRIEGKPAQRVEIADDGTAAGALATALLGSFESATARAAQLHGLIAGEVLALPGSPVMIEVDAQPGDAQES